MDNETLSYLEGDHHLDFEPTTASGVEESAHGSSSSELQKAASARIGERGVCADPDAARRAASMKETNKDNEELDELRKRFEQFKP